MSIDEKGDGEIALYFLWIAKKYLACKMMPIAQGDLVDVRRDREGLSGYSGLSN